MPVADADPAIVDQVFWCGCSDLSDSGIDQGLWKVLEC